MPARPSYGLSLASTVLAAVVAGFVMVLPSWLWSHFVVGVSYDSIVGRGEGLSSWERIFLYGGNLVLVFLGFAVYAWLTRSLYAALQNVQIAYWDTFAALVATGILAAIVGYFLPFVGLLIVLFLAPVLVNGTATDDSIVGGRAPRGFDPMTGQRATPPRR